MIKLNEHLASLPGSYLFAEVANRSKAYSDANPDKTLIKLGIGDVSLPFRILPFWQCKKPLKRWELKKALGDMARMKVMIF